MGRGSETSGARSSEGRDYPENRVRAVLAGAGCAGLDQETVSANPSVRPKHSKCRAAGWQTESPTQVARELTEAAGSNAGAADHAASFGLEIMHPTPSDINGLIARSAKTRRSYILFNCSSLLPSTKTANYSFCDRSPTPTPRVLHIVLAGPSRLPPAGQRPASTLAAPALLP